MIKIGVLTSSRADFGIYLPLLRKLKSDDSFKLEVIAFGTHLSKNHGYTLNEIKESNFETIHQIETLPASDSAIDITKGIGETIIKFSEFWNSHSFDLVICLGDRYEMFAAVSAGTPFGVKFAHIHGGETTLGAIDNAYRHSISLFSSILFVTTDTYKERAQEIVEKSVLVENVGALSIDNLNKEQLLSKEEFKTKFNIDLNKPTILSTFHPETVNFNKNKEYISELIQAFEVLKENYQLVITLPNTDTMGQLIRDELLSFGESNPEEHIVESLGMNGYLSCMKHCSFMLGNTSSGFVEASYFPKFVLNLGNRQDGRIITKNILSIPVEKKRILEAVNSIEKRPSLTNEGVYGIGDAAENIIKTLKKEYAS